MLKAEVDIQLGIHIAFIFAFANWSKSRILVL